MIRTVYEHRILSVRFVRLTWLDPYLKWAVEQPYATPLAEYLLSNPGLLRPNLIQYPPGTALLAPVQNLIHDGYPEGMNDADFCLQARIHVEVN